MITKSHHQKAYWSLIQIACLALITSFTQAQSINDAARQSQVDINQLQQQQQQKQLQNQVQSLGTSDFNFKIDRTEKTPVKKALDELTFVLNGIDIDGDKVFDEAETDKSFAKYLGKKTSLSELNEAVENLEDRYRQAGYFLSKAYIPPQKLENGILRVVVVEGYINKINVEGGTPSMQSIVKENLNPLVDKKPLDLPSVEKALLVLNSFPGYSVSSVLRQGSAPNSSEIFVTIQQLPNNYLVSINNNSSNAVGVWAGSANATLNHILGRDNQLTLGYTGSIGLDRLDDFKKLNLLTAKYAEPIGSSGLVASVGVMQSISRPGASLAPLEIQTNSNNVNFRLSYPLYKAYGNSLTVDSGITLNRSKTTTLGNPLTFDKSTVYDLNFVWSNNQFLNGSNIINVTFSKGLPGGNSLEAGDPTASVVGFNPEFSKVSFNWVRIQPLTRSWSVQMGLSGQYTSDNLLIGDTIVFGGATIGRGFDNGVIAGDKGLGGYFELRKDLPYQLPSATSALQSFGFYDYGAVSMNANATTGANSSSSYIKSYGFGLRSYFPKGSIEMQWAMADSYIYSADPRPNPRILFLGNYFF